MTVTGISKILAIILAAFFVVVVVVSLANVNLHDIPLLLNSKAFWLSLWFSLKTSIVATIIAFIFGVPAGFYMARHHQNWLVHILDAIFDIPVVIPPLIVGILLLNFFNMEWLRETMRFIFTAKGATVAQFFVAAPFTIKASKNAFELISPIYERIAMTLGAGPLRSFFDTTFKIAMPSIFSGLILTWLRCLGEFGATLIVGGAIPGKTDNLPIFIYLANTSGDFTMSMAASILIIIVAFLGVFAVKYLAKR